MASDTDTGTRHKIQFREVPYMKWLSFAICSLGAWVLLYSFGGTWTDIVFGGATVVFALMSALNVKAN